MWSDQQLHNVGELLSYDLAPDDKRIAIFPNLDALAEKREVVHTTFLRYFFDKRRRAPAN